jgi:hypothetical protein
LRRFLFLFLVIALSVSFSGASGLYAIGRLETANATNERAGLATTGAWRQLPNGPAWSDAQSWDSVEYYSTIQKADLNGDGRDELLARNALSIEAHAFDPATNAWSRLPDGPTWSDTGGWDLPQYYSTIQAADIDGDGRDELLGRGAAGILAHAFVPQFNSWVGLPDGPAWGNAGGWDQHEYYSTIQAADLDGDGRDELLARGASGIVAYGLNQSNSAWEQLPNGPAWSNAQSWNLIQYYSTIQTADINGDGRDELLARNALSIEVHGFDPSTNSWYQLPDGPAWSDAGGWNLPRYYSTIQTADINGDGRDELLGRSAAGMLAYGFNPATNAWEALPNGPAWSDAQSWDMYKYYGTIQTGDIDNDGRDELLARNALSIEAHEFDPASSTWSRLPDGPALSDTGGWDLPQYYTTIQTGDLDGDGQDELLARGAAGILAWDFDAEIMGLTASSDGPTALGQPTQFSATITGGTNVTYDWSFSDGGSASGATTSYTFASAGTYTATVTASNSYGSKTAQTPVEVTQFVYSFLPLVTK